jgi:hypothetical protein
MKVIRVPWIQCRADEAGAECFAWEWKGRDFEIMAYTRKEAVDWWNSLGEGYRGELLGIRGPRSASDDARMLF